MVATIIAVRRARPLINAGPEFGIRYLRRDEIPDGDTLVPLDDPFALLEIDPHATDDIALASLGIGPDSARFGDVMMLLGRFAGDERERVLRAIALAQWSHEHRCCPICGFALRWDPDARTKSCTNPAKTHRHFPRTDPATIMLVSDGPRALLGRQAAWPPGMYSTLAGFIEPGESAEAGVAREVLEETGIRVEDIRYFGSESWPFPRSLMLGFTARAVTSDIVIGEEMDDVRWFTPQEVSTMQTAVRERLPYFDTIARRLLAAWLATFALLACLGRVGVARADATVLPQARIDAAIASAKNLHRKPSNPGFSMHDFYVVDGTPAQGFLSPKMDDYGYLANGTDVLIVPLESGGSGGVFYTLLFTSIATKPAFIGYVPSPSGHLEVFINEGRLVVKTPVYKGNSPDPSHHVIVYDVVGAALKKIDEYDER